VHTTQHTDILKTKQHFEILDGLRGVAALAVVVFHFMEWIFTDYSKNFIGHGFLAVDFFYCLSGFVIGYAYDNRIEKIGFKEFLKSRLIRLHPLVILGTVLGLLSFFLDPFATHSVIYSAGELAVIFVCSLLLIPFPVMKDRGFNLFGLNAPSWSLFWEYVANIVYVLILYKISRRYLVVLTILSAIAICWVSYRAGNLMGGWGRDNFWDGCARISYSFFAGLLIYRFNWIIKNKIGFIGLSILLLVAFVMPHFNGNWVFEALVVLFYFPLIVLLGAGSSLSPMIKKVCEFSGKVSYPLYMTHYIVIWMFANYYMTYKPGTTELFYIITIGTIVTVIIAYVVTVLYDIPTRKYLNARR
jgi:peptidoglycan/LPS O-acetylase OafA/YrhL